MTETKSFYSPAQQAPYLYLSTSNTNNISSSGSIIGIIKTGTDNGTTTNTSVGGGITATSSGGNTSSHQMHNTKLDSNLLRQQHQSNPQLKPNQNDADTAAGGSNSLTNNSFIRRVTSSLDLTRNNFGSNAANNRPGTGGGSARLEKNNNDSTNVGMDSSAHTNGRTTNKFNLLAEQRRRLQRQQHQQPIQPIFSLASTDVRRQQQPQIQQKYIQPDEKNQIVLGANRTTRASTIDNSTPGSGLPAPAIASTHPLQDPISVPVKPDWRLKDRKMKTVGVGLIMALNLGTDPPDVVKPNPCAVLQCWIDPRPTATGISKTKRREIIGERLERQYAKWQLVRPAQPLKYLRALDPSVEDVRNLCISLRRQARSERILIHYNGHGVPRPTNDGGEIWVFDKGHTEYIPLGVTDLRQWMGKPNIVVLDCSSAGVLIPFWTEASILANAAEREQQQERQQRQAQQQSSNGIPQESNNNVDNNNANPEDDIENMWMNDTILLCPCSEGEWLPMHPDYPADIFTSCLTTPIPIALRWFVRQNQTTFFGYTTATGAKTTNNAPDKVTATPNVSVSGGLPGPTRSESPNPTPAAAAATNDGTSTRTNGINNKTTPLSATSAAAAAAANNTAALYAMIDQIPGVANDRKTPLGELNWIFTGTHAINCRIIFFLCIVLS
jgi:Raptor N-terminal CASPase like domain